MQAQPGAIWRRRRAAAVLAAVLYLASVGAAPLLHAAFERASGTPTIERAHSDLCPRLHSQTACPNGASLLPEALPAPAHGSVDGRRIRPAVPTAVIGPRHCEFPSNAVRAPPAC